MNHSNIYYRFIFDSFKSICEFRKQIICDNAIIDIIKNGDIDISSDDMGLIEDRYRTNKKQVNMLYSGIYSLKIVCILNKTSNPCREAKKLMFKSNEDYIQYLLSKMEECGYLYNDNIIEDVRNMYMRSADISDKCFNSNVGKYIKVTSLIKSRRLLFYI